MFLCVSGISQREWGGAGNLPVGGDAITVTVAVPNLVILIAWFRSFTFKETDRPVVNV